MLNVGESSHVAFYSVAFCSSAVKAENSRTLGDWAVKIVNLPTQSP
jgi:hypothetical protein